MDEYEAIEREKYYRGKASLVEIRLPPVKSDERFGSAERLVVEGGLDPDIAFRAVYRPTEG